MTDPVTNALAIQLEYGEDELKQQINYRLEEVARNVAEPIAINMAREIATQVSERYVTDQAMAYIDQLFQQRVSVLFAQTIKEQMYVFLSDYKFQEAVRNIAQQTAQNVNKDTLRAFTGSNFY